MVCNPLDQNRLYKTEAVLIAEVLSPSSVRRDRVIKPPHYRQLATLQTYLLLSQEAPRIECYGPPDWRLKREYELDGMIELPSLGCSIAVREVYEEVLGEFL